MKLILLLIPVLAYVSVCACIYTMNDGQSAKWGAFAAVNAVLCLPVFGVLAGMNES